MKRRNFLAQLLTLGVGIVVVGPSVLAEVHRNLPFSYGYLSSFEAFADRLFNEMWDSWRRVESEAVWITYKGEGLWTPPKAALT